MTAKLTWTFGIRDTFNSNPLNPHEQSRVLRGSFASISHDVNQPLNAAIQTRLGNVFASTPLAILQPRTAIAWQIEPKTVLRAGFGLFSDILPGSVADLVGVNPPYVKTFQGGLLGTVGGTAIAPGVPNSAVDATVAANQRFSCGLSQGQLSCASPLANPATCLPPVAITAVPDGKLHAPYFMQWSFGVEHQIGTTAQLPRAICRHARGEPALSDAGERISDGVPRLLCAVPLLQPTDPAIRRSDATLHRREQPLQRLQLTAMKRLGHGFRGKSTTPGATAWTQSRTAASCRSPREEFSRRCRANLAREYGPCDYDIRHNLTAQYVYQLPIKVRNHTVGLRGEWLAGLGHRVLAQRDSVLGSEHAVFRQRKWHRARQRSAICQRRSRRAAL